MNIISHHSLCLYWEISTRTSRNALNIGSLPGDIFTNNVINGAVELVAYILCGALLDRLGRRLLLGISFPHVKFCSCRKFCAKTFLSNIAGLFRARVHLCKVFNQLDLHVTRIPQSCWSTAASHWLKVIIINLFSWAVSLWWSSLHSGNGSKKLCWWVDGNWNC